jgi:signal peptidase II
MQVEGRAKTGSLSQARRWLFLGIVLVIVVSDQITKSLATQYLQAAGIVKPFGNDTLWLVYVLNPGLAFGLQFLPPFALKLISTIAAIGLGYFLYTRSTQSLSQNIPLSLIMGGAIGNLIDRVRLGEVIDFISVDTPDFMMERFPVFNIADSAVSVGVTLLFIASFFQPKAIPVEPTLDAPPSEEGTEPMTPTPLVDTPRSENDTPT